MESFRKSLFECGDKVYPGYTSGGSWNGFETPCFDHKTAEAILNDCIADPEASLITRFSYDAKTDTFSAFSNAHGDEDVEEYTGRTIVTDIGAIRVYSIGAHSWTWTDTLSDIIASAFVKVWGEASYRQQLREQFLLWINLFVGPEPDVEVPQFSTPDQAYDLIRQRGFSEPQLSEFTRLVQAEINSK